MNMVKYLINLEKDRERLEAQRAQFSRAGMEFERVQGADDNEGLEIDRFKWWCAVLRPPVKGERGCAASHCECYRRLIESGEACAAVFEDDVKMGEGTKEAVEKAGEWCRANPRAVVLLSDHREDGIDRFADLPIDRLEIERAEWDQCSEAYVIGREAAKTLMAKERRMRVPIDYWGYFAKKGWIELYRTVPAVCGQDRVRFASNLGERYVTEGKGLAERIWWKVRRWIGVALDAALDGRRGW